MQRDDQEMEFLGGGAAVRRAREEKEAKPPLVFYTLQPGLGRRGGVETLTFEQIEERLLDGRVEGQDRVRLDGEAAQPVAEHRDFQAFFVSGTPAFQRRVDSLRTAEEREKLRREQAQRPVRPERKPKPVALAALAAFALIVLIGVTAYALSGGEEAEAELPAEGLVRQLRLANPGGMPPKADLDLLWVGVNEGGQPSWPRARKTLEATVAATPREASAVGALAVVYARMADQKPTLRPAAVQLMERARALAPDSITDARMEAGLALYSGASLTTATQAAARCLEAFPRDGVCLWYQGQALVSGGHLEEARAVLRAASESLGGSPAVDVALLGVASMETLDLLSAEASLLSYAAQLPEAAEPQLLLARLYRRVGRFREATAAARLALSRGPELLEARMLLGTLLLHSGGQAAEALEVLRPLTEPDTEPRALRRAALLHASIAARRAGRGEEAVRLAEAGLELGPGSPPLRMALAEALADQGAPERVERLLRDADLIQLDERGNARFLRASAALYERLGWEREASLAREQAHLQLTDSVDAVLEEAYAQVQRGSGNMAVPLVMGVWRLDLLAEVGQDPIQDLPIARLPLSSLAAGLENLGRRGSPERLEGTRAGAVVRGVRCVRDGADCGGAQSRLGAMLDLYPDDRALNALLSQVLLRRGGRGAERALVLATGGLGGSALFAALRGEIMAKQGAVGSAVTSLETAVRLGSKDPSVLRRAAVAYARVNRDEEALKWARAAAKLRPEDWRVASLILGVQRGDGRATALTLEELVSSSDTD